MTNEEYLMAANLAKIKIAKHALTECLFNGEEELMVDYFVQRLSSLEQSLYKAINIRLETDLS